MKALKLTGALCIMTIGVLVASCDGLPGSENTSSPPISGDATRSLPPEFTPTPVRTAVPESSATPEIPSAIQTQLAAPTPTIAPYWDLLPQYQDPDGGWSQYRSDKYGIAFEYPHAYSVGECGRIEIGSFDGIPAVVLGGTIQVSIEEPWEGDLNALVSRYLSEKGTQLLTNAEEFLIDGVPAIRVIHSYAKPSATQYEKVAFAAKDGTLFSFRYALMNSVYCDALPLSEEVVYEHLLASWRFDR